VRRESTHGDDFQIDLEPAGLTEMLDGAIQKSNFRRKRIAGNHARAESSDA
jgi:hypothetical protein